MTLKLSYCVPTDAPELARLHYAIFHSPPIYQVIYAGADPADVLVKHEKSFASGLQEQAHATKKDRALHYLKMTDETTGEIAAYILWTFLPNGYHEVETDSQAQANGMLAGTNVEVARAFKKSVGTIRSAHEGRKEPLFCRFDDEVILTKL